MHIRSTLFALTLLASTAFAEIDPDGFIDNKAIERTFADTLGKQFEDKKTVAVDTLLDQLREENRTKLKLPEPPRTDLRGPEFFEHYRESVLLVGMTYKCGRCNEWHASIAGGVVLHADGIILTNYHVIDSDEDTTAIGVRTWDGKLLKVTEVLASDEKNDIAVIKVDAKDLQPVALAKKTQVGEDIFVISHPVEHFYTFTEGKISSKTIDDIHGEKRRQTSITADFAKGSSGCPVFNRHGELVGIVRATTSTYYSRKKGIDKDLQMVWKYLVPAVEIAALVSGE